jgi:hypothetical protein
MKKPIVKWLLNMLIEEPYSESHFKHNAQCWDKAEEMEKIEKLKRQLFIGKVQEIIGFEKTIELLRECNETFKDATL